MRISRLFLSTLVLLASTIAATATAETVNCTAITSVPAVITAQGVYCFTQNLATTITSGYAIDIQANSVVLDLNGFKLGGAGAGVGSTAIGIYAVNRTNITIRNGTVRGYFQGVALETGPLSKGHVVEEVRAEGNFFVGINVQGTGVIIRNNQIVSTGGSTVFGNNADAYGIYVAGTGVVVQDNDISEATSKGTGLSVGIWMVPASGLAVSNRISSMIYGILMATGKYRDNLTSSVTLPFSGGTSAGNNN